MKLTLNQAAKDCGRAKSTISKACKTGRLSHERGDKGAFLIEQAELHRVFPPTGNEQNKNPVANTKSEHGNSILQVEVEALRKQLDQTNIERERERAQLTDQIDALRTLADEQRADFRQTLAVLTDQREGQGAKRGFLGLFSRA